MEGTLWAGYNAVTDWVDHVRGAGDGQLDRKQAQRRMSSTVLGSGAAIKARALSQACKIAEIT